MASSDAHRPNIVFIMSDDQGRWAAGCYGNEEIRTPAIDSIAADGIRLDAFFCASPVCSPARASVLTGTIPSRHGIHDWLREGNEGDDACEYLAGLPSFTQRLADEGYRCGMSGKWHMGDSARPQKGFTHWYAHQQGGGPYYGAPMIRDGRPYEEPEYVTDAITEDAAAFVRSSASDDAPFYVAVNYTAPHSPWIDNHPKELVDLYRECPFATCPDGPFHPWFDNGIRWGLDKQAADHGWERTRRENLSGYFAAVTGMDHGIGRLLDLLEELSLAESTLVVFTSDNGMNMGHHGIWGKGNGTYPQNMYDTSVKVPFVARLPGRITAGSSSEALVSGYDVSPTILELAGLGGNRTSRGAETETKSEAALPGRSFASLLLGGDGNQNRDEVVVYDEYGPVRMVRTSEWKYVHRFFYGPHELYHLTEDPEERVNLADDPAYRPVVLEMRDRLEEWFARYADPERDGGKLAVSGLGQLGPVWSDTESFMPFRRPGE